MKAFCRVYQHSDWDVRDWHWPIKPLSDRQPFMETVNIEPFPTSRQGQLHPNHSGFRLAKQRFSGDNLMSSLAVGLTRGQSRERITPRCDGMDACKRYHNGDRNQAYGGKVGRVLTCRLSLSIELEVTS
ncbi:MAG: hypothetical protein MI923_04195 [Phycisphaerales bacterium]|nr:hypothetical protein [Phycisphaerales bacterium]